MQREKNLMSIKTSTPTFVSDNVGKDIPIKKPKKTPIKVIIISLILSFGFLFTELQQRKCMFTENKSVHKKLEVCVYIYIYSNCRFSQLNYDILNLR